MFEFLETLEPLHKGFWYVALASSAIFLVQTILTFIGGGDTDGISADFDGDFDEPDAPFQLFSFRNLINFLLGFGWAGVSFYDKIESKTLVLILAVWVGVLFVSVFLFLIKQILKFSENNTFKIEQLVGKIGEVYLTIPAQKTGRGKVLISHKGTQHELIAITDSEQEIPTGQIIKVVAMEGNILMVIKN